MNEGLLAALTDLEREKGIDKEILFQAIESALISAYRRNFGSLQNVRVRLDRDSGATQVWAQKTVVPEVQDHRLEVSPDEANTIRPGSVEGDIVEFEVTPKNFGRIAAQTAKQVIVQRIREAERGMIGALIMVHGDDKGLRIPPRVAPIQVVIVPIGRGADREAVVRHAETLRDQLASVCRVKIDDRDEFTPGYKFNDWEMRGVPLRLEVGPKDMAQQRVMLCRRDTGEKVSVEESAVLVSVPEILEDIQRTLFMQAEDYRNSHTHAIQNYQEMAQYDHRGFFLGDWCTDEQCADQLKQETAVTIRCLPLEAELSGSGCVVCGKPGGRRALFGRAY